jgi:CHAT domain-containing protein
MQGANIYQIGKNHRTVSSTEALLPNEDFSRAFHARLRQDSWVHLAGHGLLVSAESGLQTPGRKSTHSVQIPGF